MGSRICVFCIFMSQEYAHHDLGPRNGTTIYIGQKFEDAFTAMCYTLQKKKRWETGRPGGLPVELCGFQYLPHRPWIGCVGQHFQLGLHCQGHASSRKWRIIILTKRNGAPH
jgi:hypothetical protein